jgi:glycine cleavage system transcriptional repressor
LDEMAQKFVITATGPDQVGLVDRVTEALIRYGANVEESRMARLGGEFSILILISLPEDKAAAFQEGLAELEKIPLVVSCKKTRAEMEPAFKDYHPYEITLTGADHEGIVHSVAHFLSEKGINIVSLDTTIHHAPGTGTPIFSLEARVLVPPAIPLKELRQELNNIGDETGTDIEIKVSLK